MGLEDPPTPEKPPQSGFVLLLARLADAMEGESVAAVLDLVAANFAGLGAGAGSDQPPAFVAGDVARSGSDRNQKNGGGYPEIAEGCLCA